MNKNDRSGQLGLSKVRNLQFFWACWLWGGTWRHAASAPGRARSPPTDGRVLAVGRPDSHEQKRPERRTCPCQPPKEEKILGLRDPSVISGHCGGPLVFRNDRTDTFRSFDANTPMNKNDRSGQLSLSNV